MDNPDFTSSISTQDERIMAALAHVSIIIPYAGFAVPAIVWVTQKDKSRYTAFQSLQALAWQLLMFVLSFVAGGCYMISIFGAVLTMPDSGSGSSIAPFILPFAVIGCITIGVFVMIIYAIVGAVMAFMGKDFRYIILGDLVERFMQPPQLGR